MTGRFFILVLLSSLIPGLALADAAPSSCPPPPKAGDPVEIFPADQIRNIKPGTIAHAYTVFEGATPECFDLLLKGVDPDGFGPGQDVIIFTPFPGPAANTNIVHGMSGSPVYLDDGRLLGALSLDISLDYTVAPTGGITPAAYMMEILENHERAVKASSFFAGQFTGYREKGSDSKIAMKGNSQGFGALVGTSGISPSMIEAFKGSFLENGLNVVAGGASAPSANTQIVADPSKLSSAFAPGSMIVIPLVSGDVSMSAAGTVTYNDGKRLLAFGHPFNGSGEVKLPIMTGEVITIVNSSHESFKMTKGIDTVGSLVEDRATGIMGILGEKAPTIPMTIQLDTSVRNRTFHTALAEIPGMVPTMAAVVLGSVLSRVNEAGDGNSAKVTFTVKMRGHADYTFSTLYSDTAGDHETVAKAIAYWTQSHFDSIANHPSDPAEITDIAVHAEILPGARALVLTGVRPLRKTASPGDSLPIEASFRLPGHLEPLKHTFNVQLPAILPKGIITLQVNTSNDFNQKLLKALNNEKPSDSLEQTLKILKGERSNGALYVTIGPVSHSKKTFGEISLPLEASFTGDAQKFTVTIQ